MTTRRSFARNLLTALPATAILLGAGRLATAQAARLEESDPTAIALGYKHDATKVDPKKSPTYGAGRNCAGCQLYQGKATDPWAPCGAFGGKQVNAKGWCAAWVKKT
ncbi:MAG: high-potential iron-sulfur protein [Casimicrobiaceae bacterium]